MFARKGVEMRACPESRAILREAGIEGVKEATQDDWYAEYLAPIVAIAIVGWVVQLAGHSVWEPGILRALLEACERFKSL